MALASAQALLDELMGRDRNLNPAEKKQDIKWSDPEVCKHYFVKFCPHELFINTKADLGPCNKVHDNRLKKDYENSSHYQKMGYEEEFLRFCQSMLSEVDKRICRARQRLALGNQEGNIPQPPVLRSNEEKIMVLTERINELLSQVEHLGCEGMVEEAQGIMKLCDQLKDEREAMQKASESSHWLQQTAEIAAAQEKQMEVCDVCGAFLIVGDAQQRVDDHLMGKQHVGYAMLKNAVEEITSKRQKDREERDKKRDRDRVRDEKKKQKEEGDRIRDTHRKKVEDERKREMDRRTSEKYRRSSHSWDRGVSRSHSSSHSRNTERKPSYSSSKNKDEGRHKHRSRSRDRKRSRSPSRNSRYSRRSSSHSPEHKKDHKHRSRDSRDKSKEEREKSRSKRKERSARSQSFENGDLISDDGTTRKQEEEHEYEQETSRAGDTHQ